MNGKIIFLFFFFCVCAIATAFPATENNAISKDACRLPMARGHCRALMRRWRYDPSVKDCVAFNFGGCDGNENNFMTKKDCMELCRGV